MRNPAKKHPKGDSLKRAVDYLRNSGPMLAGGLGYEIWGSAPCGRTENTAATMYSGAAGKLLKRAKALGLVYDRQVDPQHLWYAVDGRREGSEDPEHQCGQCGAWILRDGRISGWGITPGHCHHHPRKWTRGQDLCDCGKWISAKEGGRK